MAIVTTQTDQLELVVVDTPQTHQNHDQSSKNSFSTIVRRVKESFINILTKFHAGYFRVSLSFGGQALLWKTIKGPTNDFSTSRLTLQHFHPTAFTLLWSLAFLTLCLLSILYLLKCLFRFKLVKEEFCDHVGVNYLFAPSISWLLLLQSSPFIIPNDQFPYVVLWWVFALPVVLLDVKIYGQWFIKGKKFLSAVANPTSQLSVIANLICAQAAANMGSKEGAIAFFSLGMVHYLVLFVTLYQRLSDKDQLPTMLRPSFFLFVAAPSMASLAWQSINAGSFDTASKMLFFLSLFLFMSLVSRPRLFKKSMKRFNVAWWAYSFPSSFLALTSIEYAEEVKGNFPHLLMLVLLAFSVLISVVLIIFTLVINAKILLLPDHKFDSISSSLSHLPRLLSKTTTSQQSKSTTTTTSV